MHINGIDNILCKIADPFFTGFFARQNVGLSFKIVEKAYEKENVGLHVMWPNGTFGVMGSLTRLSEPRRQLQDLAKRKGRTPIQSVTHPHDDCIDRNT